MPTTSLLVSRHVQLVSIGPKACSGNSKILFRLIVSDLMTRALLTCQIPSPWVVFAASKTRILQQRLSPGNNVTVPVAVLYGGIDPKKTNVNCAISFGPNPTPKDPKVDVPVSFEGIGLISHQ